MFLVMVNEWGEDMSNVDFWDNFMNIIAEKTNPVSFSTWFNNISLLKIVDNKITIEVPMVMHKKILGDTYYPLIEDTIFSITGINYDIEFVLEEEKFSDNLSTIIKEEKLDNSFNSNLISKYTFDNFIVGDTNRFAKTAALAVAEQPGKIYNPLFIYGKSGLGKTHLMHAIGNFITENSNLKVLYTTSDNFMNEFIGIAATRNGDNTIDYANHFKEKYRECDVLIIDDIQYLVGAEKTQQEFFHTFNALHQVGRQIIISSDKSPDDLKKLEERLRSRFTWGLPVDIFPPDFDLRCEILKNKINNLTIAEKIENDVIEFIANSCENDVRYLEGAINRLLSYAAMTVPKKIDLEFAGEALKDYIQKNTFNTNTIYDIQKAVADYYNLKVEDLKSKRRGKNIAYPRQIGMYLCRILTQESYPRIGLEFGGKEHSTVIHAWNKITEDLKDNKQLKEIIDEIKRKI